jgi:hypothetical protein
MEYIAFAYVARKQLDMRPEASHHFACVRLFHARALGSSRSSVEIGTSNIRRIKHRCTTAKTDYAMGA